MSMKTVVLALSIGIFAFGCSSDPSPGSAEEQAEIIDNLVQAGFPENDILVSDGVVYVGRDAAVSLLASREMLEVDSSEEEQYRTNNLVSGNVGEICVDGREIGGFSNRFNNALNRAIANYNGLGLSFSVRRIGADDSGCDAVIDGNVVGGTGGSAGFPSGGLPFGTINIGSGLQQFSTGTVEHVITHELGHTVGLRHSDFFNRSISCGVGGNEGDGGVGAIHIPGTPTGASVGGSLMNSCFRSGESGNFTSTDRTALQTLY
jgi:hypothetical protein